MEDRKELIEELLIEAEDLVDKYKDYGCDIFEIKEVFEYICGGLMREYLEKTDLLEEVE